MNRTIQHIAVLTGKRGGYGAMKPLLRNIKENPDLRLSLIVTDQHLNPAFGMTVTEVEQDFPIAARVLMDQKDDSPSGRVAALTRCLSGMTTALSEISPDVLVLYGDRGEVLISATAALHLSIPVAHLQGGDISGNADELMRHAVTKLSHLHFPSTDESANRIRLMGEEPWRINVVGDNHIDTIVAGEFTHGANVRRQLHISENEAPIIVLYHPETTRARNNYIDMKTILASVLARGQRTLIIYPCSDHGYEEIIRAIDEVAQQPRVSVHRNIKAPDFWGLMSISAVFVGNSSAGLIETPYFKLPAINVGKRQYGRLHADNIIHCEPNGAQLKVALDTALNNTAFLKRAKHCELPFGDGKAGERVVNILAATPRDTRLLEKRITY